MGVRALSVILISNVTCVGIGLLTERNQSDETKSDLAERGRNPELSGVRIGNLILETRILILETKLLILDEISILEK